MNDTLMLMQMLKNGEFNNENNILDLPIVVTLYRHDLDSQPDNTLIAVVPLGIFADIFKYAEFTDEYNLICGFIEDAGTNVADIVNDINDLIENDSEFRYKIDLCVGYLYTLGYCTLIGCTKQSSPCATAIINRYQNWYEWYDSSNSLVSAGLSSLDNDDFSWPKLYNSLSEYLKPNSEVL